MREFFSEEPGRIPFDIKHDLVRGDVWRTIDK